MAVSAALLALSWSSPAAVDPPPSSAESVLTNSQQVLELDRERARPGDIPVRIRGVLTYPAMDRPGWFYVQDEFAAVLVVIAVVPFPLSAGQVVEVEGAACEGIWAPFVQARAMRQLGVAPLPAPKRTPPSRLAAGADFGQWVEIEGTVRDVAVSQNRLLLLCAEDGLHFQVWVALAGDMPLPSQLLDARVRLQGIPWTEGGYDRRPSGFKLHQPGTNYLQVLKVGSADIFNQARRQIQSLRQFAGDRNARVKVTGVVTLHSPAGWLYLQDETGGLLAWQLSPLQRDLNPRGQFLKHDQPPLHPGDRIELVGAPRMECPFAPVLDDAEYRVVGQTSPPTARVLSSAQLMSGHHDAELVTLKARVVDIEGRASGELVEEKLWLQSGESVFEALLETRASEPLAARKNDFVEVTGVCRLQPGQLQQVRSFSLHLRGGDDVRLMRPPPWWTSRSALTLLAGSTLMLLAGIAWILVLRQRIAARTVELRRANERLQTEVAERKEAQAHLARFKAVAEATSDLVAMASLEGDVLFLNQAGRRLVGLSPDADVSQRRMAEFYPAWVNDLFAEAACRQALRENGCWSGEVALLHRDGHEIPVSFVGSIVRTPDGRPEYMACIIRDITERRQQEENLRAALDEQKEHNRLKTNFVSMVSHEIRTPLALILSSSEILSRYLERLPADKRQRHLDTISGSVTRMAALLEDVLLLSRAEAGRMDFRPAAMELGEFCRRLVDEIDSATGQRCPIQVDAPATELIGHADEVLLRHIFTNLLTNAVKYSPRGSPVRFELARADGQAIFRVEDHGVGIPEEDRKRLFTPFYRGTNVTALGGTGLGLVIVRHCVERHGGRIELQSREGAGTTVTVHLPLFSPTHTDFLNRLNAPQPPAPT